MKKIFIFTWVLSMCLFVYICFSGYLNLQKAATYRYGSRGQVVIEIQTRLKKWGYYKGPVDGVYGYQTYTAVKYFQRKNRLTPDGITGSRTLAALGINPSKITKTSTTGSQNVNLLGRIINGESRGEVYIGQVAVGGVIMNRVRDPRFPNTIAGVVYQPGAFTAVSDGQIHASLEDTPQKAARDAINGWDPSGGAIYYYNPAKTTNKWIWSRPVIKRIGKHVFCK